jgi:mannosyltransferase
MRRSSRLRGLLLMLILAAFALRLYRLDLQDVWWDEARNVEVAARPVTEIATAGELDIHPPVYFYLLHGWMGLARDTAFAIRFLSTWFGVLFIALMYTLGRRTGGLWAGVGTALAAAFLPFLLGEAQEGRMYTMALAWLAATALALAGFERIAQHPEREDGSTSSTRPRQSKDAQLHTIALAVFSALALLTHYAAVFALVPLWGWAGLSALLAPPRQRAVIWPRLRTLLLAGLLTALLCLPGLPVALRQIPGYRNPNLVVPQVSGFLAELARVYSLGEHFDPAQALPWMLALGMLLVGGWLAAILTSRPPFLSGTLGERRSGEGVGGEVRGLAVLALLWAVLPLLIYYLVISDRATAATRYISVALPGWLLLAGLALAGWARLHRGLGLLAAAAFVAILIPGLHTDLTDTRFFRDDTRGLIAWLDERTDPARDLILVDQRYPFGFYYDRWNSMAGGFPPAEPPDRTPAQYLFVDLNTLADRLTQLTRGMERVYWVRWFESDTDPRGAVPFMLEKFGTAEGEAAFRGYTLTWYVIAPDTRFELTQPLAEVDAAFSDQLRLEGVAFGGHGAGLTSTLDEVRATSAPADKPVWAVVRWAPLLGAAAPDTTLRQGLKATLVLEDANGLIVARDDRSIVNDRHLAPSQWTADTQPLGVFLLQPEPATAPGRYTLKLAVYDPVTLAQLPAAGSRAEGPFVTLGEVTLMRATRVPAIEQLPLDAPASFSWRGLRLLGRGPLPTSLSPGDRLDVDLYWQAQQASLPNLQVQFELQPLAPAEPFAASVTHTGTLANGYTTDIWVAGETVRDRQVWRLDPALPTGSYRLALRLLDGDEASPSTELGQVEIAGRAHSFEPPAAMAQTSGATFGALGRLLGYDGPTLTGDTLALTLYWQALGPSAGPYNVSVQLLDAGGVLAAQRDQPPGDGAYSTTGWLEGEVLADAYRVDLPPGLPPGTYTVIVKLYDAMSFAPLSVSLPDGSAAGEYLRIAEVEID